ncbi:hypothetical protein Bca101_080508 [Brassica carinata]
MIVFMFMVCLQAKGFRTTNKYQPQVRYNFVIGTEDSDERAIFKKTFCFHTKNLLCQRGVLNLTDFPRSESLSKNGSSRDIFKETQVSLQMNYDNDFSFQVIYD